MVLGFNLFYSAFIFMFFVVGGRAISHGQSSGFSGRFTCGMVRHLAKTTDGPET